MKRIIIIISSLIVFLFGIYFINLINIKPMGILDTTDYIKINYNPNLSSTFNKTYIQLKNDLLYARIILFDSNSSNPKTLKIITNKNQLVDIVKEFDKLKATEPKDFKLTKPISQYTIVIWQKGSSVSISLIKDKAGYYEGSTSIRTKTNKLVLRKVPDNLIELLDFL